MWPRLLKALSLLYFLLYACGAGAVFVNGDFEAGDFSSWLTTTGKNPGLQGSPPFLESSMVINSGGTQELTIVGAISDPRTDGLLLLPGAGTRTARVNDETDGADINIITQTATLTEADRESDGKLHVRFSYAAVLEDPNHKPEEQPYFFVHLRDVTVDQMIYAEFTYSNQPGRSFHTSSYNHSTWKWTDWNNVDIVLPENSLGHTLEVVAAAADCSLGAHGGYVYLDNFGVHNTLDSNLKLTSMNPSSTAVGAIGTTLTVAGSGFKSGDIVQWNGFSRATTFVSSTQLTATLQDVDFGFPGTYKVNVARGTNSSNSLDYSVTGTAPPSNTTVSPQPLTFPQQLSGTVSDTQTVVVHNPGPNPARVTASLVSPDGSFTMVNNCALYPVLANNNCKILVKFSPCDTCSGTISGILKISTNPTNSTTLDVPISGTAKIPQLTVSPKSLNFPNTLVGLASPPQMITYTNSGTAPLKIIYASLTGDFTATMSCPPTLPVGGSCTMPIAFTPKVSGSRAGAFTVSATTYTAPSITLSGTADPNPCEGKTANQSMLLVPGGNKLRFSDSFSLGYCMKNFKAGAYHDLYVSLVLPDGSTWWMASPTFFGAPTFSQDKKPYLKNTLVRDQTGFLLTVPSLPNTLPAGNYVFTATLVLTGKDVADPGNWLVPPSSQNLQTTITLGQ